MIKYHRRLIEDNTVQFNSKAFDYSANFQVPNFVQARITKNTFNILLVASRCDCNNRSAKTISTNSFDMTFNAANFALWFDLQLYNFFDSGASLFGGTCVDFEAFSAVVFG